MTETYPRSANEPGTWYKPNWTVRDMIENLWLSTTPKLSDRTQAKHTAFYHRQLLRRGFVPIQATYDKGGNCDLCGEAGRCPGWHYAQESTR